MLAAVSNRTFRPDLRRIDIDQGYLSTTCKEPTPSRRLSETQAVAGYGSSGELERETSDSDSAIPDNRYDMRRARGEKRARERVREDESES